MGRKKMLIREATVEIISENQYDAMLKKIEKIGRVCYKSEDKITGDSAEKFIKGIIRRGHESVIEHESISVKFICDRGVSHEIVRHRIASYSQESTRYCNYVQEKYGRQITCIDIAKGFKYDLNDENDRKKYDIWLEAMENAEKSYFKMIELGATPQEARSVLPNSLKTEIVVTMNIRGWRNFFKLRTASASHPQFREVACMLLEQFAERYPAFFEDLLNDVQSVE